MAALAASIPSKPRSLRALCVDCVLRRVAAFDLCEQQRSKADSALCDGSGDGALHRVTALKALGRVELSRGFLGLPRFGAFARGFLVAAPPVKAAAVLDGLRESVAASRDLVAVEAAVALVDDLTGAGKLKRDRGPELVGAAKNAAKRCAKAAAGRAAELRRPAKAPERPATRTFAATDVRLDGVDRAPSDPAAMAEYFERLELRVHPTRRGRE